MNSASRIVRAALLLAVAAGARGQEVKERDLRVRPAPEDPARASAAVPRGYALVVGIGKYGKLDASENLRFPESDAEAVYRILISQQGGAFPAENVHRLIGADATLANLRRELEVWLPSVALEADRVVVYFAGHGLIKGGRGYLAPYDVDANHPESSGYPMDLLGKVLAEKVRARWKVLLTDACHSGKITPETTDDAVDAQFSQLPKTFLTLTATREREKSYEDPALSTGFGLFSYFLVQGLQGNADSSPCDGLITADELIEYVRGEVKRYARQRGVSQTPNERGDFDPNMILGVGAACASGGAPAAVSLGSIVVEVNLDGVEVYVDDKLVGTVDQGKPLAVPGLATGPHTVRGVRKGYEPDTKEVMVVPGQQRPVTLRIQYVREYKRSSIDLVERGEKLLFKRTATINPLAAYTPGRQSEKDLREARELFTRALAEDPRYAKAAYDLALAHQLLSAPKESLAAFRRAIEADPAYVEARVQCAGALIEEGDPDEAIRQLTEALRLEPGNDVAHSHLARAFLDKGVWDRALEAAEKALALKENNDQAQLWRADALRHAARYEQAAGGYRTYLRLTEFSTPAHEKLAYYFVGFGLGSRRHADRQASYASQRSMALNGLCDCEHKLGLLLRAEDSCRKALRYDPGDAISYFLLGSVYRDLFIRTKSRDNAVAARASYARMIEINPHLELSRNAKNYIEQFDQILARLK
ncbi:MAG: caspase family protein [Acidobacteria bacterium]|nr:caspase family protein [Acidobacteriota bacterium]